MIIQDILFPQRDICNEWGLYYRVEHSVEFDEDSQKLMFRAGGKASFNTFFNFFSNQVYCQYTTVRDIALVLKLHGTFRLDIELYSFSDGKVKKSIVSTATVTASGIVEFPVGRTDKIGKYSFTLTALEDHCEFFGGAYQSSMQECNPIKLAMSICTYHREDYLIANIERLRQYIIDEPNSPLHEKLYIFIVDNGRTLKGRIEQNRFVRCFEQGDYGASGGFGRGMHEIQKIAEEEKITNIILSDDDIILDHRVLLRTYRLLTLLKEEYKSSILASGNMNAQERYRQVEFGGIWNNGHPKMQNPGFDLRKISAVLTNDIPEKSEYAGWWFACIPTQAVKEVGLPMPFFMKRDDQEYSLRMRKEIIRINGICVWHMPYDAKYGSYLKYYLLRNYLIIQAVYTPQFRGRQAVRYIWDIIKRDFFLYRYREMDITLDAAREFLLGYLKFKDTLLGRNEEDFLNQLISRGYHLTKVSNLPAVFQESGIMRTREIERDAILKKKSLWWGLLKNKNSVACGQAFYLSPYAAYGAKQILNLDATLSKGFWTKRSLPKGLLRLFRFWVLSIQIRLKFGWCARSYKEHCAELTQWNFWQEYMHL